MTFQAGNQRKKFQMDLYEPVREVNMQSALYQEEQSQEQDDYGFDKSEVEQLDLFNIRNFQLPDFPRNESIKQLAVTSRSFVIITKSNKIYRWRPEIQSERGCTEMEIPDSGSVGVGQKLFSIGNALIQVAKKPFYNSKDKKEPLCIERIFMDPNGYHTILCADNGDNFCISYNQNKVLYLQGVSGKNIRSVAWSDSCAENCTKEILIGTKDGKIYLYSWEFKQVLEEQEAKLMVSIPNDKQVNQIEYFTVKTQEQNFACVMATTNQGVFFFYGVNNLEIIFNKYKDPQSVLRAESTPVLSHTSLMSVFYTKGMNSKAHSFLFTNGKTLNLYKIPDKSNLNENFVNSSVYLRYAKKEDMDPLKSYEVQELPIAIGLSEFHYLLLHSDCLTIVSRITEKVVKYYDTQLRQMGNILGMTYDRLNEEFWIYSDRAVCKVSMVNEDQDAWKLLMDKKKYTEAFEIARKYHSGLTRYIAGLAGDELFKKKNYVEATKYYLQSSKSFEEIFMIFIASEDVQAHIGLQFYLKQLFQSLKEKQQRTIILSWLTELQVYRLNIIQKEIDESEKNSDNQKEIKEKKALLIELESEFDEFLKQYNNELEQETTYQLMQSHGRIKNCVDFAALNNNFEMIILHHINEENYKEAINNLRNVQNKNSLEVIQKYSYILMKHEPKLTLELLTSHIKTFDPTKIIGGLMNIPDNQRIYGIQFLEHSIQKLTIKDKSIHNIYIFFLAHFQDQNRLIGYLRQKEEMLQDKEKVYFDLDFALRLFVANKLIEPQIIIYGMMGLYTESVSLALENRKTDLSKEYARKPQDDDEKSKKLWMMIATHLLKENDENIEEVIKLTQETDLIKIEDLLPHFNENIKIEHFKDEICNSLKTYNEEIEKLKEEMKKFSTNSEQLKNELKMIKNKFLIIDTQQKCENCFKHLFNDAFYLFPCNHGFHKECLVEKIKQTPLDPEKIIEIDKMNNTIMAIIQKSNQALKKNQNQQVGAFFTLINIFGAGKQDSNQQSLISAEDEETLKKSKERFDLLVAKECVLCGPSIVDTIQLGFELNRDEKLSWSLGMN